MAQKNMPFRVTKQARVSDPLKEVVQYRLMRREKGRHITRKLPERFYNAATCWNDPSKKPSFKVDA